MDEKYSVKGVHETSVREAWWGRLKKT